MKKILLLTAAVLISGSAMAQHEHFHVFRNDNQFNTFNNVQEITYQGSPSSGYNKMQVTDAKGNATIIDIEAIDSVVVRPIGIPEFHVNLTDYPEWTELIGSKSDEHPAILRMDGNGMYDDLPEQEVVFRGRGNSTWNMKKKPYRFKMNKKNCGLRHEESKIIRVDSQLHRLLSYAQYRSSLACQLPRNAFCQPLCAGKGLFQRYLQRSIYAHRENRNRQWQRRYR